MTQSYSNSNVGIWAKQDIEQAIARGELILNSSRILGARSLATAVIKR
jgi:hypothetical protein